MTFASTLANGNYSIVHIQHGFVTIGGASNKLIVPTTQQTFLWEITRSLVNPSTWSIRQGPTQFVGIKQSLGVNRYLEVQNQQIAGEWSISQSPTDATAFRIHRTDSSSERQWKLANNSSTARVLAEKVGVLNQSKFEWRFQLDLPPVVDPPPPPVVDPPPPPVVDPPPPPVVDPPPPPVVDPPPPPVVDPPPPPVVDPPPPPPVVDPPPPPPVVDPPPPPPVVDPPLPPPVVDPPLPPPVVDPPLPPPVVDPPPPPPVVDPPPVVHPPPPIVRPQPVDVDDNDNAGVEIGAAVRIVGVGGGGRVFWQSGNGSIYINGWQPDGTPWPTKVLVPGERVRKYTPLAALCWGGALGFKQIRLYYVDNRDVLQEMLRPDGGSWRGGKLGSLRLRVSRQSRLVAKRIGGGRVRVRFRSMRGVRRFAAEVESAGDWRVVW